jgi:hypothetical protein
MNLKYLFILLLFLPFSFASVNVSFYPSTPSITAFSSGFQRIIFFRDVDFNSISLSSSDFEVFPQSLDNLSNRVEFKIKGNSPGIKNYTLIFDGISIDSNFEVLSTPLDVDGPFILTDFNFDRVYSSDQEIIFSCFGSRDIIVDCNDSFYDIGEGWVSFELDTPLNFSFDKSKNLKVKVVNDLGFEEIKTFLLKSSFDQVSQTPVVTPPSGGGGGGGGSGGSGGFPPKKSDLNDLNQIDLNNINQNDLNDFPSEKSSAINQPVNDFEFNDVSDDSIVIEERLEPSLSLTSFFSLFDGNLSFEKMLVFIPLILMGLIVVFVIFLKFKK